MCQTLFSDSMKINPFSPHSLRNRYYNSYFLMRKLSQDEELKKPGQGGGGSPEKSLRALYTFLNKYKNIIKFILLSQEAGIRGSSPPLSWP